MKIIVETFQNIFNIVNENNTYKKTFIIAFILRLILFIYMVVGKMQILLLNIRILIIMYIQTQQNMLQMARRHLNAQHIVIHLCLHIFYGQHIYQHSFPLVKFYLFLLI